MRNCLARVLVRVDWRRLRDSGMVALAAVLVAAAGWNFPEYFPDQARSNAADQWIGWINIPMFSLSIVLLLSRTRSEEWSWLTRAITWVFAGLVCLYLVIVAPHQGWPFFQTLNWIWLLRFLVAFGSMTYTTALVSGEISGWLRRRGKGPRRRPGMPEPLTPEAVLATIAEAKPIVIADETGRILYASRSATDLIGGPVEGSDVASLVPERYRPRHLAGLARFGRTGEGRLVGRVVAAPLLRRDGTEVPVHLTLAASVAGERRYLVASLWRRGDEVNLP